MLGLWYNLFLLDVRYHIVKMTKSCNVATIFNT